VGKKPDDIEREIKERRALISRKMNDLQGRVEGDINEALGAASDEATTVLERVKGTVRLEERMEQSPLTVVAGGLGLGVLLGIASEGVGGSKNGRHDSYSNGRNSNGGGGGGSALDGILGSVTGMAANVVGRELTEFLRAGLYGTGKDAEKRPEERESRRE
jgi:hypothetical protein